MADELTEADLRYKQWGWHDTGRPSDKLVVMLRGMMPNAVLLSSKSDLPQPPSNTAYIVSGASHQLVLYRDQPLLRLWVDAAKSVIVDVPADTVVLLAAKGFAVETAFATVLGKTRPFQHRIRLKAYQRAQFVTLVHTILEAYNVAVF